jgi:hypothetical protein
MLDDFYALRDRARAAAARGDLDEARTSLLAAASQVHVSERDYATILAPLADVLQKKGDARGALSVTWYAARGDAKSLARAQKMLEGVPHGDRARTLALAGDMAGAAREMEAGGRVAAAAIYREQANDWAGAGALWSRLASVTGSGADAYELALVSFNLARCARNCEDPRRARAATVASVRMLEEAADHFESVGLRERAFDCFQVLVQVGKDGGMFEDVLEGYVNCIRILREDHLKYFALQHFEDALVAARGQGELSAAATLAREAAEYARTLGLAAASTHYTLDQGELWRDVAHQHLERGAPPAIAENALLAAIHAFGDAGRHTKVGALYAELAQLDLEAPRRTHYARASTRYAGVKDEAIEAAPLPANLRQDHHAPDVWHVDLLEWEQRGSAAETCADVLLDERLPELYRRRALRARLTALEVEDIPDDASPAATSARVRVAEQLAQLSLYVVLSPLEKLFARPERPVRVAVVAALQTLLYKRTFITVRAALRDHDPAVVDRATRAVASLYFPHAFDPLARIVRESPQPAVRAAALGALANVDSVEAAEFLIGVLEHGAPVDRDAAFDALKKAKGGRFIDAARGAMPATTPEVARMLDELVRTRRALT